MNDLEPNINRANAAIGAGVGLYLGYVVSQTPSLRDVSFGFHPLVLVFLGVGTVVLTFMRATSGDDDDSFDDF